MMKTYSLYGFSPHIYLNAFLHNLVAYMLFLAFLEYSYAIMTFYVLVRLTRKTVIKPLLSPDFVINKVNGTLIHSLSLVDHLLSFLVFFSMVSAQKSIFVQAYAYALA